MASQILKSLSARPTPTLLRPTAFQLSRPAALSHYRPYSAFGSDDAVPGQSSNVSGTAAGSPEAKNVNESRATDSKTSPDSASLAKPVSDPSEAGLGSQEEQQPSQENMKRDPNEPDEKKREKVLSEGMKPLDPADK